MSPNTVSSFAKNSLCHNEFGATKIDPLLDVVGADLHVPLVTGEQVRYANLDYAASAPALAAVAAHVDEVLPFYASVHRGAGYASQVSTAVLERSRAVVGRFVGARAGDVVVFTRNTTDALNLLAGCLPAWGDVVLLDAEHHANLLPWQRGPHRCVGTASTVEATLAALGVEAGVEVQPLEVAGQRSERGKGRSNAPQFGLVVDPQRRRAQNQGRQGSPRGPRGRPGAGAG